MLWKVCGLRDRRLQTAPADARSRMRILLSLSCATRAQARTLKKLLGPGKHSLALAVAHVAEVRREWVRRVLEHAPVQQRPAGVARVRVRGSRRPQMDGFDRWILFVTGRALN